jgi:hypothetical protein
MSIAGPRKAGTLVYREPSPTLRSVPNPDERPRSKPDPETHAMLDDMQRRYRVQHERLRLGDDAPEAA